MQAVSTRHTADGVMQGSGYASRIACSVDPQRDLPRGLLFGVGGVIALYLGVNWVCVRALGGPGLAQTLAPASAVMERALGAPGARLGTQATESGLIAPSSFDERQG